MVQRIYTGTGDEGETGLFGGGRVPKSNPRVAAYGAVDELNAMIGWAISQAREPVIASRLPLLQPDLFAIGAHLATVVRPGARQPKLPPLPEQRIADLERWIDEAEAELPELRAFVMPGGSPGGAALHVARTVCRRAEREVVRLARAAGEAADPYGGVAASIIVYLNRVSDLLFVWARRENRHAGIDEEQWLPDSG
ncbi:MAG TPA: cob(I)yrinic acid a,c-diamide adenosyltransferase [Longimicrobiales bacterium]|nr:cob(I)yrinic acid a,c-diamide adenosyltransferase [Longimicrobiales bacterium]